MAEDIKMNNIDIRDFPVSGSIDLSDYIVVSLLDGTSSRIRVGLFRETALKGVKPSIGEDLYWYIGEDPTGVLAKGMTPVFRKTDGGVEYRYDTERDTAWKLLISYEDLRLRYIELTPEQVYALRMRYEDLTPEQQNILRLKYEDLTDEQKAELQRPAAEIAERLAEEEKAWKEAEESRAKAEQERVTAEAGRIKNDEKWVQEEFLRMKAEVARTEAEMERESAEKIRLHAETQRKETEEVRVSQEQIRQQWYENASKEWGNQTLAIEVEENGDVNVITGSPNTGFMTGRIEDNGDVVLEFNYW